MNEISERKLKQLEDYVRRHCVPEPAVQAVIAIGSAASGEAGADSDIDAIVFLDPYDLYAVPAEFAWRPDADSIHSIFSVEAKSADAVQLDFTRFDLSEWRSVGFAWPEERCADLAAGKLVFDRQGYVEPLIRKRTRYSESIQRAKLDEAVTWMDQHLEEGTPENNWVRFGALTAHDQLSAAGDYLAQALFAINGVWLPWRNRRMAALLALPWLPDDFSKHFGLTVATGTLDRASFDIRVNELRLLMVSVLIRARELGIYCDDPISEAFIRGHDEPGRGWNLKDWKRKHDQISERP